MNKEVLSQSHKAGLPPGTIVHVGRRRAAVTRLSFIGYGPDRFEERELSGVDECLKLPVDTGVSWINVDGLHDPAIIEQIGRRFNLHPLVQEDIANTGQRPKVEETGEHLFIVLKMLYHDQAEDETVSEQVSLVLGPNYVISFQEGAGDAFGKVRERLRQAKGQLRRQGADTLAYALIDAIVDNYFVVLDRFTDIIEDLEENLLESPTTAMLVTIKSLKRDLLYIRRNVAPMRDVAASLRRGDSALVAPETRPYFQDVYDHLVQVTDSVDASRELVSDLLDIYLSSVSNRLNEVMKVLTIFASIFIPLTFIAGIYGMNFENMPELGWPAGYFIVLGFMATVAVALLFFFRRRNWL
ncbi:magnesium and cobalt transport protein CorA [Dehalogenimonas lykanthroporepellens BL-DC-9]|nr:magnesium and cobalt transport protein CorA [Dehalogenimonas lykanthroporepellens BL-DC-9]